MKAIMFCHKQYLFLLFLSMTSFFVQYIEGYCSEYRYPRFTDSPVVTEFQPNELRVSWKGILSDKRCIKLIWVKYWEKSKPMAYKMSQLAGWHADFINIKVLPGTEYVFEVIARRSKLQSYIRSPTVDFHTRQNEESNDEIKTGKFYLE